MPDPLWLIIGVVALLLLLGAVAWWATREPRPPDPRADAIIRKLDGDEGR